MKRILHVVILWYSLGLVYYSVEGLFHLFTNGGWANVLMLPVGGFCCLAVGAINQIGPFRRLNMLWQSLIGAGIVTLTEYVSGYILNIRLGMNIWDYSALPLNLNGQICLIFTVIWFWLMPAAVWLDDFFRAAFWKEGESYPLITAYRQLFGLE